MTKNLLLSLLALAGAATAAQAQSITNVAGEAAGPGTLIALEGTNLGGATQVRFRADVGGFVGVWDQLEPVQSASDARVTVLVPDIIAGWVHEGPSAGGPLGSLQVVTGTGTSPFVPFYFFEGSNGFLASAGLGTTQASGQGRSILSFDLAGGAPTSGNPGFTPTLHNAEPGAVPVLAVGLPGPALPLSDGILAINLSSIFALAPGTVVDPLGNAALGPLPVPVIPSGFGLAMQWGYLDPTFLTLELSGGMLATY